MTDLKTLQLTRENNLNLQAIANKVEKVENQIKTHKEFNNNYGMEAIKLVIEVVGSHLLSLNKKRNQHHKEFFWEHLKPELAELGPKALKGGKVKQFIDMAAVVIVKDLSKTKSVADVASAMTTRSFYDYYIPFDQRAELNVPTMKFMTEIIELVAEETTLFDIEPLEGRDNYLVISEEWKEKIQEALDGLNLNVECYAPMIVPPNKHKNLTSEKGGYLQSVSPLLKYPTKKGRSVLPSIRSFNDKTNPEYFKFINNLQEVPYCINTKLFAVIDKYYSMGFHVEKFPAVVDELRINDIYNKRMKKKTSIAMKICNRRGEEFEGFSDRVLAKEMRIAQATEYETVDRINAILNQAEEYAQYEKIYYQVFVDNRGRTYPYASGSLSYQGDKLARSLLQFADKQVLDVAGVEALMETLADALGYDKYVNEVKVEKAWDWYSKYMMEFEFGNYLMFFDRTHQFDDTFLALAICLELVEIFKDPENYKTGIICHRDARVSGSSIIGTSLLDKEIMEKTSVLDWSDENGKLGDSYQFVADKAKELCEELAENGNPLAADLLDYNEHTVEDEDNCKMFSRKAFKKNVMTYVQYGLSDFGLRRNNWENANWGDEDLLTSEHKALYDEIMLEALKSSMPTCFRYLDVAREVGSEVGKRDGMVSYKNPMSGFPVAYTEFVMKRTKVEVNMPGNNISLTLLEPTDKVNHSGISTATPPNLVHSLDASMLFMTCKDLDFPVSLIHDSIGARPNDVKKVVAAYANAMKRIAETNPLNNIIEQMGTGASLPVTGSATQEDIDTIPNSPCIIC